MVSPSDRQVWDEFVRQGDVSFSLNPPSLPEKNLLLALSSNDFSSELNIPECLFGKIISPTFIMIN